jgi:heme oxygenase
LRKHRAMDLEHPRRETLPAHHAVEESLPLMDEDLDVDTYASKEAGPASLLGAMYVMEGSTLGGQLIARHVELVLGLTAGQGNAYLRGHNERTGQPWKEFCNVLRTKVPDSETDAAIAAAKAMFGVFGSWMRIS